MKRTPSGLLYTTCVVRGLRVGFDQMHGNRIAVGVSGWLVGHYSSADEALFAAAEEVRMKTGCGHRSPTIPARTRRLVATMIEAA
jgi:hypothetical protein